MDTPEQRLAAIAEGQLGMVARRQAHLVGVTDNQLRSRVTSGSLESLGPNAYRLFGAARTPHAELLGLILDVGPNASATGPTAAALIGFDTFVLGSPFHIVIARGRRVRRPGHHVHRSMDLDAVDLARIDGVASITPARTLIELARTGPPGRLAPRSIPGCATDASPRSGCTSGSWRSDHRGNMASRSSWR